MPRFNRSTLGTEIVLFIPIRNPGNVVDKRDGSCGKSVYDVRNEGVNPETKFIVELCTGKG